MSNKFTDNTFRRAADERFSIAPLQDEIDARFAEPVFDTYTVSDLKRLRQLASTALRRQGDKNDIYDGEVFVVAQEDTPVYYVEPDGNRLPVSYGEDTTLHGYIRDFKIQTLPDYGGKQALVARVEEFFDDDGETQSYHIPLAIEGVNRAPRLYDAPVPVAESGVEVGLDTVYEHDADQRKVESDEQDVQWSLLNIIEQDLFGIDGSVATTRQLSEQLVKLLEAGFIDDISDFASACNYYFAKCAHDNDAVYLDVHGGIMMQIDGPIGETTTPRWVEEKVELVAVDFEVDEDQMVAMTVYCHGHTDDGVKVYCSDSAEEESWSFTSLEADDAADDDVGE